MSSDFTIYLGLFGWLFEYVLKITAVVIGIMVVKALRGIHRELQMRNEGSSE
ncbi:MULTISPECIES: hypothetical protein [Enterococcus]|uniref:hypothetical protein n=1 Tax=Enterococcus TaxID=1350 RepID=UPI001F9D63AB|nr:hypothetical protein [Enterococcus diestrammenae]HIX70644.1 hypothetical protein [Candidatus Enterococcus stercoravium]